MSFILERLTRWRWIHPLPSNPPNEPCLDNDIQRAQKKRTSWLSFQNHKKRKKSTYLSSRSHFIKQKYLLCSKPRQRFQLTFVHKKQRCCGYKCLDPIRKNTFANKTNCLSPFGFENCENNEKQKQKLYCKGRNPQTFFRNSCGTWICNVCRKTNEFFRTMASSSQDMTFENHTGRNEVNDIAKSQQSGHDGKHTYMYIDEVKVYKEHFMSNPSSKLSVMDHNVHPLSSLSSGSHTNVKGYFYPQQHLDDNKTDSDIVSVRTAWNQRTVTEEKYCDPRLCRYRLDILNQNKKARLRQKYVHKKYIHFQF